MRLLCALWVVSAGCSRGVCDRIQEAGQDCVTTNVDSRSTCEANLEHCDDEDEDVLHGFLDCMDEGELWCDADTSESTAEGRLPIEVCYAKLDALTPRCWDAVITVQIDDD